MRGKQSRKIIVYAKAMYELAVEQKIVDQVLTEFELCFQLQKEVPSLKNFLELSFFPLEKKHELLKKIFGDQVSRTFQNFIGKLLDANHFHWLNDIYLLYREKADAYANRVRAAVTSAIALDDQQRDQLAKCLRKTPEQQIIISNKVDPKIISGLVVRMGDLTIDGSLKRQLEQMRRHILRQAAIRP